MKQEVLYIFGGEKAQGAEIVIERLISANLDKVNAHLFLSPGHFADKLISEGKQYPIIRLNNLRKLYRSKSNPVAFYSKAIINYLLVSYKVYRYIRRHKINVIHTNTIIASSYLLPLIVISKLFGSKRKWLWSDHDLQYFSRLEYRLANWCLQYYDVTLVVSRAVQKKYLHQERTIVLYNGLDVNYFKPDKFSGEQFRNSLGLSAGNKIIGIAASICPGKGQLQLIRAFRDISANFPEAVLLVAGTYAVDDVQYNQEVELAMNDSQNVRYLGFVEDMLSFYNACDITVSNSDISRSEALGTSIYEAMSCGNILVASATGGTPEIISDNSDGFLFTPESQQELTATLNMVMDKLEQLDHIKIAARKKVAAKFNITVMVENYNRILLDTLNK